jgi:hypothetical protein
MAVANDLKHLGCREPGRERCKPTVQANQRDLTSANCRHLFERASSPLDMPRATVPMAPLVPATKTRISVSFLVLGWGILSHGRPLKCH